ncbi:MAG: hypothetical protein E7292_02395 [Lachnospiraceae bacterium]|nr:hypothetical protein [Lachnospiraceae bacterium]
MSISIISFTKRGMQLSEKIVKTLDDETVSVFTKCSMIKEADRTDFIKYVEEGVGQWAQEQMAKKHALLFIGACGIAVRAIAPYITDKLHDSPVLVMDENGEYIIPILAGHMGGANEIAMQIALKTGAIPVITTATDLNHKFAVDVFAKKNGLHIVNKDGIATVSSKVLAGKTITLSVERGRVVEGSRIPEGIEIVSYPPKQVVDILITAEEKVNAGGLCLRPREYIVGMGCRRGKEPEKIADYIQQKLDMVGISKEQVYALASIDKKKDEEGLIAWCRNANVPFGIYTAEELEAVEGDFKASDFVKEQVGVDNVCERAALRACGKDGRLILHKQAEDGMTIAIARREWSVKFDEE